MQLHFAPLQGYTTALYRRLHHTMWGGIAYYYTPFVRIEKGDFRRRDISDIAPENNEGVPVVPQMLLRDVEEMHRLTELFLKNGYNRADINMGCPFPPVALHGRGAGLIARHDDVQRILQATQQYPEMQFSVKMRLGWQHNDEWQAVADILNDAPLTHITIHPRIGKQQYKGSVDMEAFDTFYNHCTLPIVYNGDIETIDNITHLAQQYPRLQGIMIGRGLLARPYLPQLLNNTTPDTHNIIKRTQLFHDTLYNELQQTSQGDSQLLQRTHALWQYFLPHAPHKARKAILKSTSPQRYTTAVAQLFDTWITDNLAL